MNDWKETTNFQDIEEKPEKKETAYDRYQAKMHSLRIRIPKERLDELNRIVKDNFHMSLQAFILSAIDDKIANQVPDVAPFYKPRRARNAKQPPHGKSLCDHISGYLKRLWPDVPLKVEPQYRLKTAFLMDQRFLDPASGHHAFADDLGNEHVDLLVLNSENNDIICCIDVYRDDIYGATSMNQEQHYEYMKCVMREARIPFYVIRLTLLNDGEAFDFQDDQELANFLDASIAQYQKEGKY